jgi:hypothetical protein
MAQILILHPKPEARTMLQLLVLRLGHVPVSGPYRDVDVALVAADDLPGQRRARALRRVDPRLPILCVGEGAPVELRPTSVLTAPVRPSQLRTALADALSRRPEVRRFSA